MKGIAVTSILGLTAAGWSALVIDDFSTGPFTFSRTAPGVSESRKTGSMIGDSRWVVTYVLTNPSGVAPFTATVASGKADFSAGMGLTHKTDLRYGYQAATSALDDMNLNLLAGGNTGLKLQFTGNESDLTMKIQVGQHVGNDVNFTDYDFVVAGNQFSPFNVFVPYSVFGSADLTDVDQMIFRFQNSPSGDFGLEGIEAVPEPATIIGLGLGIAALARRRRKA